MKSHCPYCSKPIYRSSKETWFSSNTIPAHTMVVVLEAEWCTTQDCYQRVKMRNFNDPVQTAFVDEVLHARDRIEPVATGLIQRGRRISQYDPAPSMRKTTIKDAKHLCGITIARLNAAINAFSEKIF